MLDTADLDFLNYLIRADAIMRTTGWRSRKGLPETLLEIVETLEDNGYDTIIAAMLRGYEVSRNWLSLCVKVKDDASQLEVTNKLLDAFGDEYDYSANAIPTRKFERKLWQVIKEFWTNDTTMRQEELSMVGSDEQWDIVCNTLEYLARPDNFEEHLT